MIFTVFLAVNERVVSTSGFCVFWISDTGRKINVSNCRAVIIDVLIQSKLKYLMIQNENEIHEQRSDRYRVSVE